MADKQVSEQQALLRQQLRGSVLKRENVEVVINDAPVTVAVHEVTSGKRLEIGDLAKKLDKGQVAGGSRVLYRKLLLNTIYLPGTEIPVWDDRSVEEIDQLGAEVAEPLVKKALEINGLTAKAGQDAKNDSSEDGSSFSESEEKPAS